MNRIINRCGFFIVKGIIKNVFRLEEKFSNSEANIPNIGVLNKEFQNKKSTIRLNQ
jgi:hypothetical protein